MCTHKTGLHAQILSRLPPEAISNFEGATILPSSMLALSIYLENKPDVLLKLPSAHLPEREPSEIGSMLPLVCFYVLDCLLTAVCN